MSHDADRSEAGIWPLQDHRATVPEGRRAALAGARIIDPKGADDRWAGWVYDDGEGGKGTVGDIHPWRWWEADGRDCGAWAQAMFARVSDVVSRTVDTDSKGRAITGGPKVDTTKILPIRTSDYRLDQRFMLADHVLPGWLGALPKGTMVLGAAGTEEKSQEDLVGSIDPRLRAVHKYEQDAMGTWVCDLARPREMGDDVDNDVGRRARLQSHVRVYLAPALGQLKSEQGPSLAWVHTLTGQGKQLGMGAIYGRVERPKKAPVVTGDRTGPKPVVGDGTRAGSEAADRGGMELVTAGGAGNGNGVGLMAWQAWGGMHPGHQNDQHRFDVNKDGEPINSGHLAVDQHLWYRDKDHDAPLEFDRLPYGPVQAPLRVRAWIRYDMQATHPWVDGQSKRGLWRLEAESYFTGKAPPTTPPPTTTPRDPVTPTTPPAGPPPPTTPGDSEPPNEPTEPPAPPAPNPVPEVPFGPGSPGYPYPPGYGTPDGPLPDWYGRGPRGGGSGGSANGDPVRYVERVDQGAKRPEHVVWSPAQLGIPGALVFPQHYGRGGVDLRYSAMPPEAEMAGEAAVRPAVLRLDSWGKQSGASWGYTQQPGYSRVPGGTAPGGMLVMPPEVDAMDRGDSLAPSGVTVSDTYFGWGDGAAAAWGVPDTATGGLASGAFRAKRTPSGTNGTLTFDSFDGTSWTNAVSIIKDSNGLGARVHGTGYLTIPSGTTAQRPATPAAAMVRLNTSSNRAEVYDGSTWKPMSPTIEAFTGNDTLTEAESGKTCTNEGAAGAVTLTLPAAAAGLKFTFIVVANQTLTIQLPGTDVAQVNATGSSAGGTVFAATKGRSISFECVSASGGWYCTSQIGTWSVT